MNRYSFYFMLFVFMFFYACKKDEPNTIVEPTPVIPINKYFVLQTDEDSIKTVFKYNANWRIAEIQTYNNEMLKEKITYTINGSALTKTSTSDNNIFIYYLNKKGFADSVSITKFGLLDLKEYFTYNSQGYLLEKKVNGNINSVPYNESNVFTYENGNLIKCIQTIDADVFTTEYSYYLDSTNVLAGTDETASKLIPFTPQSKSLVKKVTYSDDTFIEYSYSKDDYDNLVINTINQLEVTKQKTVKVQFLK